MPKQSTNQEQPYHPHPGRACMKMAIIFGVALLTLAGLVFSIEDQTLDTLKHTLSIGNIIVLVLVINLASLMMFMILYAAYQWVRKDLKPPRPESRYQESD